MDIPINANVICAGEICGHSTCLIVNPVDEQVTHVVVTEKEFPNIKRLVPVGKIASSTADSIQLDCNQSALSNMDAFEETDFIEAGKLESQLPYSQPFVVWPYGVYNTMPVQVEHENIPTGEVAIRRYTPVKATDGHVGKVDEFVVDSKNANVTHLVLREGHLWGEKDVSIPVSEIKEITQDAVLLKLDKKAVAALPAIPVKRRWK